MRLLATLLVVLAVGFLGVMGYYWVRDGSLQSAGREMDQNLAKVDRTSEPLQDSLARVGEGVRDTLDNATDGDDRT